MLPQTCGPECGSEPQRPGGAGNPEIIVGKRSK